MYMLIELPFLPLFFFSPLVFSSVSRGIVVGIIFNYKKEKKKKSSLSHAFAGLNPNTDVAALTDTDNGIVLSIRQVLFFFFNLE